MTRSTEQRIADILHAIDRCTRYVDFGVDVATVRDVVETHLPNLSLAIRFEGFGR